jgi:hypothetical protein
MNQLFRAAAMILVARVAVPSCPADPSPEKYLAFQLFTASHDSADLARNYPPSAGGVSERVDGIIRAIGTVGSGKRRLGFIVGPLSFDETDGQVRQLMRDAFAIAVERGVATGFHVDDSMFWERLAYLDKPENFEWADWNGIPNTGRRLDWSSVPTKIMPQLCYNSPAVVAAVRGRAALIGQEVARGLRMLQARGRGDLFIGVIAGWETKIGRDFETGKYLGFHALANSGYSSRNPPADIDQARVAIVRDFIDLWAKSLAEAGVPDERIYSHIAFMSRASFEGTQFGQPGRFSGTYAETTGFTPPSASLGAHHRPGFSTYPQFGLLEQIQGELKGSGDPPWISAEGTAADPSVAERGGSGITMEKYLGNLYGRGAVVVNVFGWGVGPPSNPFRRIAENGNAIAAYRRFLRGEDLPSDPPAQVPSAQFFDKLRIIREQLPPYLQKHGPEAVGRAYEELGRDLKQQHYGDAERAEDEILGALKP